MSDFLLDLKYLASQGAFDIQKPAIIVLLGAHAVLAACIAMGARSRLGSIYPAVLATLALAYAGPLRTTLNGTVLPALYESGLSPLAHLSHESFWALWVAPLEALFTLAATVHIATSIRLGMKASERRREKAEARAAVSSLQAELQDEAHASKAGTNDSGKVGEKSAGEAVADVTEEVMVSQTPSTTGEMATTKPAGLPAGEGQSQGKGEASSDSLRPKKGRGKK